MAVELIEDDLFFLKYAGNIAAIVKIIKKNDYFTNAKGITNPFKIAKVHGIHVKYLDIEKPWAFTTTHPFPFHPLLDRTTIYISSNVTKKTQTMLMFHELGHIFIEGKNNTLSDVIDYESEYVANFFASYFVDTFDEYAFKSCTFKEFYDFAQTRIKIKKAPASSR